MSMVLEVFGNATKDAEVRATKTGDEMAIVTVAVNRKDKDGNKAETCYVPVMVFGEEKVWVASRIRKGDLVAAKGAMSNPSLSADGAHINFNVRVTDADVFCYISRKAKREPVVANSHLAPDMDA